MTIWGKVFKNGPSKICGSQPLKYLKDIVCLRGPYPFKFFKGCLSQILLSPLLNTLSYLISLFFVPYSVIQLRGLLRN